MRDARRARSMVGERSMIGRAQLRTLIERLAVDRRPRAGSRLRARHALQRRRLPATLVTCYPFYYMGSAPQRFIVRGVIKGRT